MKNENDEAILMGQVAGIIAVMSGVVQSLPPTTRKRVTKQLHAQFDSLLAEMSKANGDNKGIETKGAKWVRDLFLQKIAEDGKKPKVRKAPSVAEGVLDIQL